MNNYRIAKITTNHQNKKNIKTNKLTDKALQPRLFLGVKFSELGQESEDISSITALEVRPSYKVARASIPTLPAKQVIAPPIVQQTPNNELSWRVVSLILLIAAAATTGLYFGRQYFTAPPPALSAAEQVMNLNSTIFTGTIKPVSEIKIAATVPAIVQDILVRVGDKVTEGQALMTIDDREANLALSQAELEKKGADQQIAQLNSSISSLNKQISELRSKVTAASGNLSLAQRRAEQVPLRQRQDSPERAQAVYEQALARFQRNESLFRQGLLSAQELDEIKSQLKIAEADLKVAQTAETAAKELSNAQESQSDLQNQLVKKEQQQQLVDLQNQLESAKLRQQRAIQSLDLAKKRTSETTVKATRSGIVVEIPVKIGDQVIVGTTLGRLAQLDQLIVAVPVSARLINSLELNQNATIKLPINNQTVTGKIITINPLPAENLTHMVEIEFENSTNSLLAGQTAEVKFLTK